MLIYFEFLQDCNILIEVSKSLAKFKFDRICITLDGSNSLIHDSIRGKGTFDKAVEGIKNLQKYDLPVSTLFTLNKKNVNDIIDAIKFNESLNIKYMSVMVVCPTGRASDGRTLVDKEQWYPIFLKLSEMQKNQEINLKFKIVPPNESSVFWLFYFPLKHYNRLDLLPYWMQDISNESSINNNPKSISCQAGIKACSINYNGDVYGCDLMMGIEDFKAGNIKQNSIKNIWNDSPTFKKLREISFENLSGKCKDCEHQWCGGGCRSAAYNLTNSILGSDESCFFIEGSE